MPSAKGKALGTGARGGAASGAAIGTAIAPGIGTLIGGALGAIGGGIAGALGFEEGPDISSLVNKLKRRTTSVLGLESVRELTGPLSESRRFAAGSSAIAAGEAETIRRTKEAAGRARLGPGFAASAELQTRLQGAQARGALRAAAAESRARTGFEVQRGVLQTLSDLDVLKYTAKAAQARERAQAFQEFAKTLGTSVGLMGLGLAAKKPPTEEATAGTAATSSAIPAQGIQNRRFSQPYAFGSF